MDIRPILSTLRRHKTAAVLIVLEIALSCAIICNALFIIGARLDHMQRPSGHAEDEIVRIRISGIAKNADAATVTRADLEALRSIPGVRYASATNQVAFGNSSWGSGVRLQQDQTHASLQASMYMGDRQLVDTMGLRLVTGRQFLADEFSDWDALNAPGSAENIPSVIISKAMADKLFPGEDAVGKAFYSQDDEQPHVVVGVVEHLPRPRDAPSLGVYEYGMLFPVNVSYETGGTYLLRVDDPSRREEVIQAALKTLEHSGPTRILPADEAVTFEKLRADYYRSDRAMAWLLVSVIVALLVVTALGIVGLASFWVQQRTKQIGVRRALGATRGQILRYFQTENFILATIGIVIGMLLAFGLNQLLMERYELSRLPLAYLPVGAIALWVLGQIAVYWPARRAASVPPAVATRSV